MTATAITATINRHFNQALEVTSNTIAKDTEYSFIMDDKDWKYAIIVKNGSTAGTFTIKAGDGLNATEDLVFSTGASKTYTVTIESDKYKFLNGEEMNKVILKSSQACEVQIVKLP